MLHTCHVLLTLSIKLNGIHICIGYNMHSLYLNTILFKYLGGQGDFKSQLHQNCNLSRIFLLVPN